MGDKLFRLQRPNENVISGRDFVESYKADEDCGQTPPNPRRPVGRWICGNSHCTADTVRVEDNYYGMKPPTSPPTTWCPRCRQKLRFLTYLEEVRLLPYREGEESPHTRELQAIVDAVCARRKDSSTESQDG
jgi:hypothetical protein